MIKAVLFDLDGVLSHDWHFESLNTALGQVGFRPIPFEDHLIRFNGLSTPEKLKLLGVEGLEAERVAAFKRNDTEGLISIRCHPDEQITSTLCMLKTDGYLLGCVTNSGPRITNLILDKMEIGYLFDVIVTSDFGGLAKPNPDPYLHALQALNLSPPEALVLEDSPTGARSAEAAGCRVLPVRSRSEVNYEFIRKAMNLA